MSVKPRPVFLEIPNIRLPIPGIVSILHRISGVALFGRYCAERCFDPLKFAPVSNAGWTVEMTHAQKRSLAAATAS